MMLLENNYSTFRSLFLLRCSLVGGFPHHIFCPFLWLCHSFFRYTYLSFVGYRNKVTNIFMK